MVTTPLFRQQGTEALKVCREVAAGQCGIWLTGGRELKAVTGIDDHSGSVPPWGSSSGPTPERQLSHSSHSVWSQRLWASREGSVCRCGPTHRRSETHCHQLEILEGLDDWA
jgi:hypothetical protein